MNELVEDCSQTPPVYRLPMAYFLYHLWSQILRSATNRKLLITALNIALGKSKVSQFYVSVSSN